MVGGDSVRGGRRRREDDEEREVGADSSLARSSCWLQCPALPAQLPAIERVELLRGAGERRVE